MEPVKPYNLEMVWRLQAGWTLSKSKIQTIDDVRAVYGPSSRILGLEDSDKRFKDLGEGEDDITVPYGFVYDPTIRIKDDTGLILQRWIDTGPIL